jgi:micrococcal nuclease
MTHLFNVTTIILTALFSLNLQATDVSDLGEPSKGSDQPAVQNTCEHTPTSFNCIEFLRNYDGDTLTINIPNVHPLIGEKISVRVFGIDAPEKRGTKPCEKDRARKAQRLVNSVLKSAQRIDLKNIQRDKYFRVLAEVWADGVSVADILIKNGLAYPYDGGTKPQDINWCRSPASTKGK